MCGDAVTGAKTASWNCCNVMVIIRLRNCALLCKYNGDFVFILIIKYWIIWKINVIRNAFQFKHIRSF